MKELPTIIDLTDLLPVNKREYSTVNHIKHDRIPRGDIYSYDTFIFDEPLDFEGLCEFSTKYLEDELSKKRLEFDQVLFMPADTVEHVNTYGKPLYVFMFKEGNKYVYQFETHFYPLSYNTKDSGVIKSTEIKGE